VEGSTSYTENDPIPVCAGGVRHIVALVEPVTLGQNGILPCQAQTHSSIERALL